MPDYDLYYWSVPFRGQFVRAVLAFAGKSWSGPRFAIAQTPAILLYLGETLDLMPATTVALRAMTMKIVNDANDVIDEITLDGGREMWTKKRWQDFIPRLKKWMSFWEEAGRRHGLTAVSGFLVGGTAPGSPTS